MLGRRGWRELNLPSFLNFVSNGGKLGGDNFEELLLLLSSPSSSSSLGELTVIMSMGNSSLPPTLQFREEEALMRPMEPSVGEFVSPTSASVLHVGWSPVSCFAILFMQEMATKCSKVRPPASCSSYSLDPEEGSHVWPKKITPPTPLIFGMCHSSIGDFRDMYQVVIGPCRLVADSSQLKLTRLIRNPNSDFGVNIPRNNNLSRFKNSRVSWTFTLDETHLNSVW